MRKPQVIYSPDETIANFIRMVVGKTEQDEMIGSEILFGTGLASRELILVDGQLTIRFKASADLKTRLGILQREAGKKVSS